MIIEIMNSKIVVKKKRIKRIKELHYNFKTFKFFHKLKIQLSKLIIWQVTSPILIK